MEKSQSIADRRSIVLDDRLDALCHVKKKSQPLSGGLRVRHDALSVSLFQDIRFVCSYVALKQTGMSEV